MITDNNLKIYIDYLDSEITKSNKFGKESHKKYNDLESAEKWYSIAEAFKVAKEKAIEILKS